MHSEFRMILMSDVHGGGGGGRERERERKREREREVIIIELFVEM